MHAPNKIFIFTATTGAGKTSITKELQKRNKNIIPAITTTSRKPRPKEKNGRDYYFVSSKKFKKMISNKEFLEWDNHFNTYYGISKKEWQRLRAVSGKIILLLSNIVGAITYKKKFPGSIVVLIKTESIKETEKRLKKRGDLSAEAIAIRITAAKKEAKLKLKKDYVIINRRNKLGETVDKIEQIIEKELKKRPKHTI